MTKCSDPAGGLRPFAQSIAAASPRTPNKVAFNLRSVKQSARLMAFATVMAAIAYPAFAVFGVIFLKEGRIVTGIVLLACVAYGVPSFIRLRRRFASRNARPS